MSLITKNGPPRRAGLTLVELLVYGALLVVVLGALGYLVLGASQALVFSNSVRQLADGTGSGLERIVREIRRATNVDLTNSLWSSHPGKLVLITTDDAGNPTTATISLTNSTLTLALGAGSPVALVPAGTMITNLVFRLTTTPLSRGVKIELTAARASRNGTTTALFNTTALLRGGY